jgi:SAM-dependent methyltransferase
MIPTDEMEFNQFSFRDVSGRMFTWKGRSFTAISSEFSDLYSQLFDKGIVDQLIKRNLLIETSITDHQVDGYEIVLEHKKIPFITYPFEWPREMLKRASLLEIDLEIALAEFDLTLKDASSYNVLFDGTKPYHFNICSIQKYNDESKFFQAYENYYASCILPIKAMESGKDWVSRKHLIDLGVRIGNEEKNFRTASNKLTNTMIQNLPEKLQDIVLNQTSNLRKKIVSSSKMRIKRLNSIRQKIDNSQFPAGHTVYSDYYHTSWAQFTSFQDRTNWTDKQINYAQIIGNLPISTILDIGCNRGWYSQLAASYGHKVVSVDIEVTSLDKLFHDACEQGMDILPLFISISNPTPGYGVGNKAMPPAIERLSADVVIAFALMHHLVFAQKLEFDQIVEGLTAFCKKKLLVEFIPLEDEHLEKYDTSNCSWYTLDNFTKALEKHYDIVKIYPSTPSPRIIIECDKKIPAM